MKRRVDALRMIAVAMLMATLFAVPGLAADTGTGNVIDVTVPGSVAFHMDGNGNVVAPGGDGFSIVNNGTAPVAVSSMKVTGMNGWALSGWDEEKAVDGRRFALRVNGIEPGDDGTYDVSGWTGIGGGTSRELDYEVRASMSRDGFAGEDIASVVYTFGTMEHPVEGTLENDGWEYTVDDGTGTITLAKYVGSNPNPTVYHAYSVTTESGTRNYYNVQMGSTRYDYDNRTGNGPFCSNPVVETVEFQEGVKLPDGGCLFCDMPNLRSVDMGLADASGVRNFGDTFYLSDKLETVDFGDMNAPNVTNVGRMFSGCKGLKSVDLSGFDVGGCTDMGQVFTGCSSLETVDLTGWDAPLNKSWYATFRGCSKLRSVIGSIPVTSSVTNMQNAFKGCGSLDGLDTSGWDTSNVESFNQTFANCGSMTMLDTSGWDVGHVRNFSMAFDGCGSLRTLDVADWNTGTATNMYAMFSNCVSLHGLDVSGWDTSNVTNTAWMFHKYTDGDNLDVSGFRMGKVADMSHMFQDVVCTRLDTSAWDTGSATDMFGMFSGCRTLQSVDVSGFNTANVRNITRMFFECNAVDGLDVSGWDTGSVTEMVYTFFSCNSLTGLDVSNWDTSNVTSMYGTFYDCRKVPVLDVSGWNTSNCTNMGLMFWNCNAVDALPVGGFDTSSVENFRGMFFACSNLSGLDVANWDVSGIKDARLMFGSCYSLKTLDVSKWSMPGSYEPIPDFDEDGNISGYHHPLDHMFGSCYALETLDMRNTAFTDGEDYTSFSGSDMFYDCRSLTVIVSTEEQKELGYRTTTRTGLEADGLKWKIVVLEDPSSNWEYDLKSANVLNMVDDKAILEQDVPKAELPVGTAKDPVYDVVDDTGIIGVDDNVDADAGSGGNIQGDNMDATTGSEDDAKDGTTGSGDDEVDVPDGDDDSTIPDTPDVWPSDGNDVSGTDADEVPEIPEGEEAMEPEPEIIDATVPASEPGDADGDTVVAIVPRRKSEFA